MKIKDITKVLEQFAPLACQESYDNCGLLIGDQNDEVNAVLISLDVTEEVVEEAIQKKCGLIIAHHPIIFSGIKKLNGKNYVERVVIKAIKNNIAIYAAHTNADNVKQGVNAMIAEKIGLLNTRILLPKADLLRKLITYCPAKDAEKVRMALFGAGAGSIGHYDQCSFNSTGTGTFRALKGANPFVGTVDQQHHEEEEKIEVIFESYKEHNVLSALRNAHPYEEVAYDILALQNLHSTIGSGMVGELSAEMDEKEFLLKIKEVFKTGTIKHTGFLNKKVKRIAVCGGSGSFLTKFAINSKSDVYITSDIKYHEFFDAEKSILIADIGHYESEQYTKELFFRILSENFSNFALYLSEINTNPVNYL